MSEFIRVRKRRLTIFAASVTYSRVEFTTLTLSDTSRPKISSSTKSAICTTMKAIEEPLKLYLKENPSILAIESIVSILTQ